MDWTNLQQIAHLYGMLWRIGHFGIQTFGNPDFMYEMFDQMTQVLDLPDEQSFRQEMPSELVRLLLRQRDRLDEVVAEAERMGDMFEQFQLHHEMLANYPLADGTLFGDWVIDNVAP